MNLGLACLLASQSAQVSRQKICKHWPPSNSALNRTSARALVGYLAQAARAEAG
jgi:hypothetical protein